MSPGATSPILQTRVRLANFPSIPETSRPNRLMANEVWKSPSPVSSRLPGSRALVCTYVCISCKFIISSTTCCMRYIPCRVHSTSPAPLQRQHVQAPLVIHPLTTVRDRLAIKYDSVVYKDRSIPILTPLNAASKSIHLYTASPCHWLQPPRQAFSGLWR